MHGIIVIVTLMRSCRLGTSIVDSSFGIAQCGYCYIIDPSVVHE